MNAQPVTARRVGVGLGLVGAVAAALLTSGCAAGQHAATSDEKPTLDGTNATVGSMALRGLAIETPDTANYPIGSNPQLKLVLVNSGRKADQLTSITSSAASGWAAYNSQADAEQATAVSGTGGVSGPKPLGSVTVAPGARVSWGVPDATGALLLRSTKQQIFPGSTVRLTFTFAAAGSITVAVPVQLTDRPITPSYVPSVADAG